MISFNFNFSSIVFNLFKKHKQKNPFKNNNKMSIKILNKPVNKLLNLSNSQFLIISYPNFIIKYDSNEEDNYNKNLNQRYKYLDFYFSKIIYKMVNKKQDEKCVNMNINNTNYKIVFKFLKDIDNTIFAVYIMKTAYSNCDII